MPIELSIPRLSEDEATNQIIRALKKNVSADGTLDLYDLAYEAAKSAMAPVRGPHSTSFDGASNLKKAQPFYSAAWRLCVRGILSPVPTIINQYNHNGVTVGNRFCVTEYGQQWLAGLSDYDCAPTEYGRFAQMLSNHSGRLGAGYHARSQEAVSTYRAQTYLACCAMCGAAAESITLALAIAAKNGNEEEVLSDYSKSGGRGRIERSLAANQDANIINNLRNFTTLLNYWRDEAAHGASSVIGEEEAFTSLILLLRFARFADERWSAFSRPAQ